MTWKRFEPAWSALFAVLLLGGAVAWTAAMPVTTSATIPDSKVARRNCAPILLGYQFKIGLIRPAECQRAE